MAKDFSLSIQTHRAPAVVEKVFLSDLQSHLRFKVFLLGILSFFIFLIGTNKLYGQPIDDYEETYWFRYYNQLSLTEKWNWHNEIEERRLINPDRQSQLFIHTHLHYQKTKKIDFAVGFNFNETTRSNGLLIAEWRPWQEVSFSPKLNSQVKLSFRYRLDERFIHKSTGSDLAPGYNFNLRHRFRIQAVRIINKKESITLKLSDEVMLNSGETTNLFDQNRIYLGADFKLSKKCSLEVGYVNQLVKRNDLHIMFNVLRTTFWHKLNWKQPKN